MSLRIEAIYFGRTITVDVLEGSGLYSHHYDNPKSHKNLVMTSEYIILMVNSSFIPTSTIPITAAHLTYIVVSVNSLFALNISVNLLLNVNLY